MGFLAMEQLRKWIKRRNICFEDIVCALAYIFCTLVVCGLLGLIVWGIIQFGQIIENGNKYREQHSEWIVEDGVHYGETKPSKEDDYVENLPNREEDAKIICEQNGWSFMFWNGSKVECK